MTAGEDTSPTTGSDAGSAATGLRHPFVAGLRLGLIIHGAAALLFAVLTAIRIEGCDVGDSTAEALILASGVDVVAGSIAFGWKMRSYATRAAAAGLALSFVPAYVAVQVGWVYVSTLPSGCPV
jgi:hypothetical protein